MSYSRRELYAMGEPFGDSSTKLTATGGRIYGGGGGGGGDSTQTQVVDLPEWAKPYAKTSLGQASALTNPANQYQQYTGSRQQGFMPMQDEAFNDARSMTASPLMGSAANMLGQAGMGAMYAGQNFNPYQASMQSVNAPYLQNYQMQGPAGVNAQYASGATMGAAQTSYRPDLQNYQMQGPANVNAQYASGATMGAAQTSYRPDLQNYQMQGPAGVSSERINAPQLSNLSMQAARDISQNDLGGGARVNQIQAAQMGAPERIGTQNFGNQAAQDYMSPYMQQVVDIQKREANRTSDIQRNVNQAQAVGQGAFGGSRSAIVEAERQRNLGTQLGDIQTQGSQAAYDRATQMFTSDQARQLQAQQSNQQAGLQGGLANLSNRQQANVQNEANRLQASGMNAQQAMQIAMSNQQNQQQANLQNLSAGLQTQGLGAQTGLQAQQSNQQAGLQAALANQNMGYNVGNTNLQAQLGTQNLSASQQMQTALANMSSQQQANVQNQAAQLQTQGLNAQQAMQAALANQNMSYNVGNTNLQAQLGTQNLSASQQMQTALANMSSQQQANVQNQAAQLQTQGLNAQQALQAALANQNMSYNVGNTNLQAMLGVQNLGSGQQLQAGIANQGMYQNAQQLAEQSRQYGAGLGLQGYQAAMTGANQLAGIGQQTFGQEMDINKLQQQYGTQQQQYYQQGLDNAYQNFQAQRLYPYQQLEFMSGLMRGTPMGTVSSMYQPGPSTMQNLGSLGMTAAGMNSLMRAKGGTVKSYKKGGEVTGGLGVIALNKLV